ncbi:MAG: hypothetical protein AAFR26_23925 [Cyanobacteria bacterium J06626_4]
MGKYDSRDLVAVQPFNGSSILYGFRTNVDQGDRGILGHVAVNNTDQNGLVIGANSPKPARAMRKRASGTTSSFIDFGAIAAARAAGWTVGQGKIRRGGTTPRGRVVYVTYKGFNYAWVIPNDTYANLGGDAAALGLRESTANDIDLVFGADSPKPPRAFRTIGAGDDTNVISTFYDPSGNLPAGWGGVSQGIDTSRPQT